MRASTAVIGSELAASCRQGWRAPVGLCTVAALLLALPVRSPAQDLARFLDWFAGEYNNNEQIWQQAQDGVATEDRHRPVHHVITPVSAPAIGEHVFLARQYHDGDYDAVRRQRLYSVSLHAERPAIEMKGYHFRDQEKYRHAARDHSLLLAITGEELRHHRGCTVHWRLVGDHYVGDMDEAGCVYYSESLGRDVRVTDAPRLSVSELVLGERGFDEDGSLLFGHEQPYRNRRVRYFSGWAAIRHGSFAPESPQPEEMLLVPDLRLHNEGQIVPLVTRDGDTTGYSAELARLTYQNTRVAVLKLAVLDSQTGDTVAYAWANPGADRVGINLGWLQVGFTAEEPMTNRITLLTQEVR